MNYTILRAEEKHLSEISDIYNHAITHSTAIFHWHPKTKEEMQVWFEAHTDKFPLFVALSDGVVIAWSALSPSFPGLMGYLYTVENSIYVKPQYQGNGLGNVMLKHLCEEAKNLGYHSILSKIVCENEVSIALHSKNGFAISGTLQEAGYKFNRFLDVTLMQKIL